MTSPKAPPRARTRRERGASAVEFALIVLPLLTMIFGALEFGLALQARTMAGNAAREGVRIASLGGTDADVEQAAQNALSVVQGAKTLTTTCRTAAGTTCTLGDPANSGGVATVTVTIEYHGITGMFPGLTSTTISRTSTMRIE
ncbi:MAG: TadE/TadG family type IV pilus assembly protein [Actinomycetia bacterium]|nr:TadE/TadG family type IV pilus assembly protein [Actinomycetes bacterium]